MWFSIFSEQYFLFLQRAKIKDLSDFFLSADLSAHELSLERDS